ncbi:PQQ-dependent sugar dehydrogenase [Cellvibrio mixtus]|uniref:PQQ-dependent sugar dehydrogenase n=1 Tax=Cellvibrio mixtus TaxID=39650 RepID=UPI0006933953|nr:sorbosone dehydrogenase family protein [Cellvibrio mixtus]
MQLLTKCVAACKINVVGLYFLFGICAPVNAAELPLHNIKLPPGFEISVFAENVVNARSLVLSDAQTLFVSTRNEGKVYAIKHDGTKAQKIITIASGLNRPNGVAFRKGSLYVAEVNRILRYDNIEAQLENPPKPVVVTEQYPSDNAHGWKFIRFGPDGLLYVPIGAPCNICEPGDPYASITRIDVDKRNPKPEIFARGIRNTVGFDWHPQTGELWFTENGRDHLGDDIPPEELNRATKAGQHFGYPYCHGGDIPDPEFGSKHKCAEFTPPEVKFQAHSAALGIRFYTGPSFPAEYRNQAFIAHHGSWNRSKKSGYKLVTVNTNVKVGEKPQYKVFAEGWLNSDDSVWGRPVDLLQLPDGSLLVSDDYANVIYRIAYKSK